MAIPDRRNSIRAGSSVHTSYECLNDDDEPFRHGIGRTLNVSKGGICLETYDPVEAYDRLSMTMMIEDELVEANGRVVYCDESKDKKYYRSGVEFLKVDDSAMQVLDNYIESGI